MLVSIIIGRYVCVRMLFFMVGIWCLLAGLWCCCLLFHVCCYLLHICLFLLMDVFVLVLFSSYRIGDLFDFVCLLGFALLVVSCLVVIIQCFNYGRVRIMHVLVMCD